MQQQCGEREPLLLVLVQLAVPALRDVEQRLEALETEAGQSAAVVFRLELVDARGIGERFAKCAGWQVRRARHVEQLFSFRVRDSTRAPRPQSPQGTEQQ